MSGLMQHSIKGTLLFSSKQKLSVSDEVDNGDTHNTWRTAILCRPNYSFIQLVVLEVNL